jgi:hypothetical protein
MQASDLCPKRATPPPKRRIGPPSAHSIVRVRVASLLAAGLVAGLLANAPAWAESDAPSAGTALDKQVEEQLERMPSGEEGVNQIMAELDARLKLSSEQQKEVRSVVAQGVAALEKLRDRFKAGELTAMAFGVQVQMQMQKLGFLVEPLLNADQQGEYKAMRQEQRREMMQAMQRQRMGAAAAK